MHMYVYTGQREIQGPFSSKNLQWQQHAKLFFYIMQNKIKDFTFPVPPLQPPPEYLHQLRQGEEGRAQTCTVEGLSLGPGSSEGAQDTDLQPQDFQKSNHHGEVL